MTCAAGSREAGGYVIGIRRPGEIGLMAPVAAGWSACEHVIDVAIGARKCAVHPRQCVPRVLQVIELRIEPGVHRVATLACRREPCLHVVQNRSLEILLVA